MDCLFWILSCLSFKMFQIVTLIRYIICKYILPFCRLPICFADDFLHCAKRFKFDSVPFVYFCFCSPCLGRQIKKKYSKTNINAHTGYDFFRGFMVSGLTFRYVIYFEFVYMVWENVMILFFISNCPILPAPLLLKRLFSHYVFLPPLL